MSQLPTDCLNEVFEYLENDKTTLHSCLLINRLWCKVSVRILWRSVWNYNTLISCLPKESKENLYKNKITIIAPNSTPPLFNYASFIKSLKIDSIIENILNIFKNHETIIISQNFKEYLLAQEIFKLLMNQISSLRELHFYSSSKVNIPNITFAFCPGAKDCLKNLSVLSCNSGIYPEFFYQLSQMCHNIHSLNIEFEKTISAGLTDLISVQQNLKYLEIIRYDNEDSTDIISSLTNLSNTLTKLTIFGEQHYTSLFFIANFTNLQELILSFYFNSAFIDFEDLQYVTFSQLQVLKFRFGCPRAELLIKFLENNGKNLKEFYVDDLEGDNYNSLNLSIAKFCPNLRKLYTEFKRNELETLKIIFIRCQYLESIKLWCGGMFLNEKKVLEVIAKYSPKNVCELKLCRVRSKLLSEELKYFFISWANRIYQKSLSLTIVGKINFEENNEIMKIIEINTKLGIIKNFKVLDDDDGGDE